jgi:hypothetical protein
MTYGWAILIVLVVLAALYFLGVFSPSTSASCIPVAPFTSCDVKISTVAGSSQINVKALENAASSLSLIANGVSISGTGISPCAHSAVALTSGATATVSCGASPGAVGTKYTGTATVSYVSVGGITHNARFQIKGSIEP